MKSNKIKELSKEEYKHLVNCLSIRGARKDYANIIGKSPAYVTRMLGTFKIYDAESMSHIKVKGIYECEYENLNRFIKTL